MFILLLVTINVSIFFSKYTYNEIRKNRRIVIIIAKIFVIMLTIVERIRRYAYLLSHAIPLVF